MTRSHYQRARSAPRRRRSDEEWQHQCQIVRVLVICNICFAASLNGVHLSKAQAGKAKAAGMVRGEPDLRIYDPPPAYPDCVGMVIELKTPDKAPKTDRAGRFSGAEPHQRERLEALEQRRWHCVVAYGATDALTKMAAAGYSIPPFFIRGAA